MNEIENQIAVLKAELAALEELKHTKKGMFWTAERMPVDGMTIKGIQTTKERIQVRTGDWKVIYGKYNANSRTIDKGMEIDSIHDINEALRGGSDLTGHCRRIDAPIPIEEILCWMPS